MKKNPKLNVRLLRRIQRHILEEPKRFQMMTLAIFETPGTEVYVGNGYMQRIPECGTTQCISGWANTLSGFPPIGSTSMDRAKKLLGLRGFSGLFYDVDWPEPFRSRYTHCATPRGRAKAAADRIEHLIQTGE